MKTNFATTSHAENLDIHLRLAVFGSIRANDKMAAWEAEDYTAAGEWFNKRLEGKTPASRISTEG